MRIAYKLNDGIVISDVEEIPTSEYMVVTDELENKFFSLIKPDINIDFTDFIESITAEEITKSEKERYNELDIEYTNKISDLVTKHVQKFIIDGTPIPQEVIDERERLKQEFYELTKKMKELTHEEQAIVNKR